jgi:hypothetical protein
MLNLALEKLTEQQEEARSLQVLNKLSDRLARLK